MDNMEAGMDKGQDMGGFCIEICVMPDGKITVESGPLESEGEATGTPVGSIDEALMKAKELFAQGGWQGEEAFNAGFGKPQESPMMVRVREGE
ncbi:MAG TPA: hypothetical protein VK149_12260 [Sideroxyarcus sp.]|nr:hypothetical protein [Sideroxyarcus sp.]